LSSSIKGEILGRRVEHPILDGLTIRIGLSIFSPIWNTSPSEILD
jgi:hypothetical protein